MGELRLATPVALFIFNRPDSTERVFAAIRAVQPQKLLVVADGPRPTHVDDAARCEATRSIIRRVDWDCDVSLNYSDANLGCKRRITTGLEWIFDKVEEAIVLEDDCLPGVSFFYFCQSLLARYRDDDRILLISGDNFLGPKSRDRDSYYFSKYTFIWGWASWRRAFRLYDPDMRSWPEFRSSEAFEAICPNRSEREFWRSRFDAAHAGKVNTWDYQMLYACWRHHRFAIVPERNLVSNIGFSPQATHLALYDEATSDLPIAELGSIVHPAEVQADRWADEYVFRRIYQGRNRRIVQHFRRTYRTAGLIGLGASMFQLVHQAARLIVAR